MAEDRLSVEVAHAEPLRQFLRGVDLAGDATVREAVLASGLLETFPQLDLHRLRVGVWNRIASLDTPLRDGDRVEVYRPLQVDPKAVRRERAETAPPRRAR